MNKILNKCKGVLSHGEYALLQKRLSEPVPSPEPKVEEAPEVAYLFVSETPLDGDLLKAFESEYAPLFPDHATIATTTIEKAEGVIAATNPEAVYSLGSPAQKAMEQSEVVSTYLPHPHAFLADPPRALRKIKQTLLSNDEKKVTVTKIDEESRIIMGVVLSPHQFDAHGDWIPAKEVESTAHAWLAQSRTIGMNHVALAEGAEVVESFLVHFPSSEDRQKAFRDEDYRAFRIPFGDQKIMSGDWVIGVRLTEAQWATFKQGEIDAFSIGGFGVRVPTASTAMPKVDIIELD